MKIESTTFYQKSDPLKIAPFLKDIKLVEKWKLFLIVFLEVLKIRPFNLIFFRWKEIILNLADRIASRITVDVQKRDSMNILDYVHIKKLHVDVEEPKSEVYQFWLIF